MIRNLFDFRHDQLAGRNLAVRLIGRVGHRCGQRWNGDGARIGRKWLFSAADLAKHFVIRQKLIDVLDVNVNDLAVRVAHIDDLLRIELRFADRMRWKMQMLVIFTLDGWLWMFKREQLLWENLNRAIQ